MPIVALTRRAWLLWACLWLAACSSESSGGDTRLVVIVSATPTLAPQLDRIEIGRVGATNANLVRWLRNAPAGEKPYALPLALRVAPDTHEQATLSFRGYAGNTLKVERLAKVAFRSGKTLLLSVLLSEQCANVTCGQGNTCGNCGECTPLQVDLDMLSEVESQEAALDAWQAPRCDRDAGMSMTDGQVNLLDGSMDGSMSTRDAGRDGSLPEGSVSDASVDGGVSEGGVPALAVSAAAAVAKAGCYPVQITQQGTFEVAIASDGASMFSDNKCTKALSNGASSKATERTIYVALTPPLASNQPNLVPVTISANSGAARAQHVIEVRKPAKRLVRGNTSTCVQLVDDTLQCMGSRALGLAGESAPQHANSVRPHKVSSLDAAYSMLIARESTACAIVGGAARCWGADRWGQLGNGAPLIDSYAPVAVTGLASGVSSLEASADHTCAVKEGNVYCWGRNDDRRIVDTSTGSFATPELRSDLGGTAVDVGTSDERSCALLDTGIVKCWRGVPNVVTTVDLGGALAKQIGGMYTGMCALTEAQGVFCWGNCPYGDCQSETPAQVALPAGAVPAELKGLATAGSAACTWTNQDVYCWGANTDARPGNDVLSLALPAIKVTLPSGLIADVAVGSNQWSSAACAIVDGLTYCWGMHLNGELGVSTLVGDLPQPASISLLDDLAADDVFLGSWFWRQDAVSAAVHDGAAWFWGKSAAELGTRDGRATIAPVQVGNLTSGVAQVSFGASWAIARANGHAYTWGASSYFSLGAGPIDDRALPTDLFGDTDDSEEVVDVTAGFFHGCAVVRAASSEAGSDTRLYCWGQNQSGQVGADDVDGGAVYALSSPTLILDEAAGVTDVASTYSSTCAVAEGALWCWGDFNGVRHPTAVTGLATGVERVEMSDLQACVLTTAGAVKCISQGESGITTIILGKPADGIKAVDLEAGPHHACALGDNGKLYCWGSNESGQLGAGDQASHAGAIEVQGLVGSVTRFSVGYELGVTCAKDSQGWKCWGNNSLRAMGLEPFVQATPRLVLGWEN